MNSSWVILPSLSLSILSNICLACPEESCLNIPYTWDITLKLNEYKVVICQCSTCCCTYSSISWASMLPSLLTSYSENMVLSLSSGDPLEVRWTTIKKSLKFIVPLLCLSNWLKAFFWSSSAWLEPNTLLQSSVNFWGDKLPSNQHYDNNEGVMASHL